VALAFWTGLTDSRQLARSIVNRGAGFHAEQARREPGEEDPQLGAAKALFEHRPTRIIDAVDLEDLLSKIDTDGTN